MKIQGTLKVSGNVHMYYQGNDPHIKGDLTIIDGNMVACVPPEESDFIGDLYIGGTVIFINDFEYQIPA
jgi:hypothetical protein